MALHPEWPFTLNSLAVGASGGREWVREWGCGSGEGVGAGVVGEPDSHTHPVRLGYIYLSYFMLRGVLT